jgi:predicted transcriptional regulator
MKKRAAELTPLELLVMQVLWETGPATLQVVHQKMQPLRPLAYNTVQTVLTILHRKGKVKRLTQGRAYVYSAAVSQERAATSAVKNLVDRLFGGRPETLVLNMVKNRQLTAEQLRELQKLVAAEGSDGDR